MNNLPPAVAYGRIDPRKKPAAASIRPPTRPDAGLASSVGNSTGYSRVHAASTFWILVRVCGSRSEERRVGKECRAGLPAGHQTYANFVVGHACLMRVSVIAC